MGTHLILRAMGVLLVFALMPYVAHTHHAIGLDYSTDVGTVEGIVTEVFWANPHTYIYIRATNVEAPEGSRWEEAWNAGVDENWAVGVGIIEGLVARGWSRDTVRPGDRLIATGRLGRDGTRRVQGGQSLSVMRNGQTIIEDGAVITE